MKRVIEKGFFFSYASENRRGFARALLRALEDRDAAVSADFRTVQIGRKYARPILNSLRKHQFTVLCITRAYLRKYQDKRSMIKREVQLALSLSAQDPRRRVLPVCKGIDVHTITRTIPALSRIHIYEVDPDDDRLRDAAIKVLFACGLGGDMPTHARTITIRTSYGTYVRAVRIHNGRVLWAADRTESPEEFTVEFLPLRDESVYQQVRLRHNETALYVAQSTDPAQPLLVAQSEVGPPTAFTTYTSEGALQLRCQNGKLVDMEPETGQSLLCADAERRADAAGFMLLPKQNAAVCATVFDHGRALAVVAQNWQWHVGVRFRQHGQWLPWAPILWRPREAIGRVVVAGGSRDVLVLMATSDSVFCSRVSPDASSSTNAATWIRLKGVKPGEINAISQPSGRYLLLACSAGNLRAAEWDVTRTSIRWREIAQDNFHGPILLERMKNGQVVAVARQEGRIVALNMATGKQARIRTEHLAPADIQPVALASTDASHLLLVAVDVVTKRAYCVEFSIGDTPLLATMDVSLYRNVHLFRLADRELLLVASSYKDSAFCMRWKNGAWSSEPNLYGIFLSALAACRDELGDVRIFGEGLDGVIFTKRFGGEGWPDNWSRLKSPPPMDRP